jgi:hypothetical protein
MSSALDTARAFESAWQGKDFEKARTYLADDVVIESPFGRDTSAEAVVGQYVGFSQVVTGPGREIAGFGDDESAVIMTEIPSVFGLSVNATYFVVRDGKITAETLVYDATEAKRQLESQQQEG